MSQFTDEIVLVNKVAPESLPSLGSSSSVSSLEPELFRLNSLLTLMDTSVRAFTEFFNNSLD